MKPFPGTVSEVHSSCLLAASWIVLLGPIYTERQRQHCDDASCRMGLQPHSRVNPLCERHVAGVIAALTLTLSINRPSIFSPLFCQRSCWISGRVGFHGVLGCYGRADQRLPRWFADCWWRHSSLAGPITLQTSNITSANLSATKLYF